MPKEQNDVEPLGSESGAQGALTLKKGLSILSLFDADNPEWAFTDIWKKAGLSRPTAFRLVKTLEEAKYLSFDATKGAYHLGVSILKGSYLMLSPSELARIARPYLDRLTETSTETSILSVEADHVAIIAARVLTPRPFKPDNPVGLPMPGFANVHTRIFLAYRPESEWRAALKAPLEKRTPYTQTDPEELAAELVKIRREGVAFGMQEWNLGMCAVAAPIFDAGRQVRGSLAIVTPTERFGVEEREAYATAVLDSARQISTALGYERDPDAGGQVCTTETPLACSSSTNPSASDAPRAKCSTP
jgi:DNA-binding IclR family transcriptional regulator